MATGQASRDALGFPWVADGLRHIMACPTEAAYQETLQALCAPLVPEDGGEDDPSPCGGVKPRGTRAGAPSCGSGPGSVARHQLVGV